MQQATATEQNAFLELFYDKYISQLIFVLADACEPSKAGASHAAGEPKQVGAARKPDQASAAAAVSGAAPSALAIIVDLLCFCVQHHSYRIK